MQIVELVRAEHGANKIDCTKTLRAHCGLRLSDAKAATDDMLERKYPKVSLRTADLARLLIVALAEHGVVARFAEGREYSPQERLASVLSLLQPMLTPEVLRTCESLAGHGEWELSLFSCLAYLPTQSGECDQYTLDAVGQLAIEFGLLEQFGLVLKRTRGAGY